MKLVWTPQLIVTHTALTHPLIRFHAIPRLVRTIGSHYQHSNPSVDTRAFAPFSLVRHVWRFDRRAYTLPRHLDYVSRSACVRRGTWTAGLSSRYPISKKECLHAGCATSSTPRPTLANPETLGLS